MDVDFTSVGRLIASPARSSMVSALLDGRALTATELARLSGVSASTASEHLAELTRAGLLTVVAQGRHRYFRISNDEIATALEALARICAPVRVRSLRTSLDAQRMARARLCYDHLAGEIGVAVHDALVDNGWLTCIPGGYELTTDGRTELQEMGVDVSRARARRRRFAFPCLDWTSRRYHLAGALAAEIAHHAQAARWVVRNGTRRGFAVTPLGEDVLAQLAFTRDSAGVAAGIQ